MGASQFPLSGFISLQEEVIEMEEKKEAGASIWVWVIVIAVAVALVVGFVMFLRP